ncbi:MAG: beta strand repeat-containing protein, partial [Caldimonas sp.]
MKTRPNKIARSVVRRGRFALHPLSFAICLGLSGAALALPQGGRVVAGDATISKPSTDSEVIRQTTDKAIVDWKSFSIAAGEKVRFYQPSSTSVTLNRVTGFDPSYILGQMSSNGKIFLVNPYGVVFGAGARVDVGGLVVSTLSIANNDFLAGRYSLTSVDPDAPAQRGAIRNEGTISSPGGLVVLAGPSVSNTGTIVANGGRVGLVAANAVSVDVEGDGLLFFQTSATEAKNRLEQLGRIQADGGTVEMRAAARGAFADTVLNMTGVVQARAIGSREGKIVIDGGSDGVTAVSGRLDATGLAAGERGGSVTVAGQRVLLDNGSVVEASGNAGGGSIRIGGGFHGADSDIHNAEVTGVASGAVARADATESGDGGKVAIWADGTTRFYGTVSAQGGKTAGDGGFVEVSGKQNLVFRGDVSTLAPKGKNGTLLLDPADIVIAAAPSSLDDTQLDANVPTVGDAAGLIKAGDAPVGTATISTAKLEAIGAANSINLNASNSITVNALTSNVATPNTLTLNTAGGGAQFHAGAGGFTMQAGDTIKVTNGSLTIDAAGGTVNVGALQASGAVALSGTGVTLNAPISVTAAGAGVTVTGPTTLVGTGGAISLTGSNAANDVTLGTVNGAGRTLNVTAGGGDIVLGAVGGGAALATVTLSGNTASLGAVTTTGAQNYSAVATTTLGGTLTVNTAGAGVSAGATALGAGGGTITLTGSNAANDVTLGTVSGARPLVITAGGGDVILGAATGLTSTTITANTADLQAVTTSGAQNYSAVTTTTLHDTLTVSVAGAGVSAGATTLAAGGGTIALTGSNAANDVTLGAVNGPSTLDITANGGDVTLGTVGAGTALAGVSIAANTAALQNVTTNGNQTYNAVVSA